MKIITFNDIINLKISISECIEWAKFVILHKNEYVLPEKTKIGYGRNCFFTTMPAFLPELNIFGVKEVSRLPNRVPALKSDILLYDSKSGELLSFMDGTWITAMRTGAVAAITIQMLKNSSARNFSFIGLGNTARTTLLCYDQINNHNKLNVNILAYKNQHIDFIERFKKFQNIHFKIYTNTEELIKASDVVVSCVTATDSVFADEKIFKKGVLVVPVHSRGFQNCDLAFDKIFCDDIAHVSEFKYFSQYKSITEMTDVLRNTAKKSIGRERDSERLLAYNIGISLQDIYFASKVLEKFSINEESIAGKFWV